MWPFRKKEREVETFPFVVSGSYLWTPTSVTLWAWDYEDAAHQFKQAFPRHLCAVVTVVRKGR